jgi:CRP/FNR family cyclic AMP-dependent transcriptional regulator
MRKVLYILGQLDDVDVEWLAKVGRREKHPAGHVLIKHGVMSKDLYIVIDGSLRVELASGVKLAGVGVGEILGEISLVDSRPPSASVVVDESCVVLAISQETLRDKLKKDLGFGARFYRALAIFLANRMRSTMQTLGYGKPPEQWKPQELDDDADLLDDEVLDGVYNAGMRFERLLKMLAA